MNEKVRLILNQIAALEEFRKSLAEEKKNKGQAIKFLEQRHITTGF